MEAGIVKKIMIFVFCIAIVLAGCSNTQRQLMLEENKRLFEIAIKSANNADALLEIELSKLTDFKWDTVYTFRPYTHESYIFEKIGFVVDGLVSSMSETAMQILFVYDNKLVCHIYGLRSDYAIESDKELVFMVSESPVLRIVERNDRYAKWEMIPAD